MQVQHECQLLAPVLEGEPSEDQDKSLDLYTLHQTANSPVDLLVNCPSNQSQLLVAYIRRPNQVNLFNIKDLDKHERFPLKACDKKFTKNSFVCKGIDFSPDGQRIAVGQTDCIIYIYKITNVITQLFVKTDNATTSRPTITGKFTCSNPITCLLWCELGIIFGSQDGKIKLIEMTGNSKSAETQSDTKDSSPRETKVINIYSSPTNSMPISLSYRSNILSAGFVDTSVVLLQVITREQISELTLNGPMLTDYIVTANKRSLSVQNVSVKCTFEHSCQPTHVRIFDSSIYCAGCDGRLSIRAIKLDYLKVLSTDLIQDIDFKEDILTIDYSEINEMIVVGTKDRIQFIKYDQEFSKWRLQNAHLETKNPAASLTGILWTRDGSHLVASFLDGSLELFRCSWNKNSVGDQFDICHIAKNRVRICDKSRNLLATYRTQQDICKVNLLDRGQSVIIWTSTGLLLAQLADQKLKSQIHWTGDTYAKFLFDPSNYVFIHKLSTRDLLLIKLGCDEIIYKVKLEKTNRESLSISSSTSNSHDNQPTLVGEKDVLAFVSDNGYLNVINLINKTRISPEYQINSIKAIKFSFSGKYLAIKDGTQKLNLLTFDNSRINIIDRKILKESCEYFAWIGKSDILIFQSEHRIFLLYDPKRGYNHFRNNVIDTTIHNPYLKTPIIDLSLIEATTKAHPHIISISKQYELVLSNSFKVPLDLTKIMFKEKIIAGDLESGFQILSQRLESKGDKCFDLWLTLGWSAINLRDINLAIRCFEKLNHKSMVKYLSSVDIKDESSNIKLIKLLGHWDLFERNADISEIITTYRRLNKWSRLIEYLMRTQQFRQRDLVEDQFVNWLISKGRFREAADLQVKAGKIDVAIELLVSKELYNDAAKVLIKDGIHLLKSRGSTDLRGDTPKSWHDKYIIQARNLADKMSSSKEFSLAAQINHKLLGDLGKAIELYLLAKDFESALALSLEKAPDRVSEIKESYADHLMETYKSQLISRKSASAAIDLLVEANKPSKGLTAAIELKQFVKAYEILKKHANELEYCHDQVVRVAEMLVSTGNRDQALEILMLNEKYKELVDFHCRESNFEAAYDISISRLKMSESSVRDMFCSMAKGQYEKGDSEKAEKIYLMLERPEAAIQMHKELGNYKRMLELTQEYQPDQMESSLFQLARQFEASRDYHKAETYLLQVSLNEWTNVVRMYRSANLWADAYRVARANCLSDQDPLLIQLAYLWCKSIIKTHDNQNVKESIKETNQLLERLNIKNQVLEFCCDNKNFQLALEICQESQDSRRPILKRYVNYLEQQGKYRQAEEILVSNGEVQLAAKMYIDNDMQNEAIELVENLLNSGITKNNPLDSNESEALTRLLNETLISSAYRLVETSWPVTNNRRRPIKPDSMTMDKLTSAQQLFLRAQKPELAVNMYKERGLWQEAAHVAQRFAPKLMEDIERQLDEQLKDELGPIVAMAAASRSSSNSSLSLKSEINATSRSYSITTSQRLAKNQIISNVSKDSSPRLSVEQLTNRLNLIETINKLNRTLSLKGNGLTNRRDLLASQILDLATRASWGCCLNSCGDSFWINSDVSIIWSKLRDSLSTYFEIEFEKQESEDLGSIYKYLIVSHLMNFQCVLVNALQTEWLEKESSLILDPNNAESLSRRIESTTLRSILSLVAKISVGILCVGHPIVEPKCAYYLAGLWLLTDGQKTLARVVWTRLLELVDEQPGNSRVESELKLMGIPTDFTGLDDRGKMQCDGPSAQQVAEVRAWLLASLIESEGQSRIDELVIGYAGTADVRCTCLASGLAAAKGNESLILGRRLGIEMIVRRREWDQLLKIRDDLGITSGSIVGRKQRTKDNNSSYHPLSDIIDFISRISGYDTGN